MAHRAAMLLVGDLTVEWEHPEESQKRRCVLADHGVDLVLPDLLEDDGLDFFAGETGLLRLPG